MSPSSDKIHRPTVDQDVLADNEAGMAAAQICAEPAKFLRLSETLGRHLGKTVAGSLLNCRPEMQRNRAK